MNKMSTAKRRCLSALMTVTTVSGLLMATTGTAEAQTDKRVCGNFFKAYPNGQEVVYFKIFKVQKDTNAGCGDAVLATNYIGSKWGLKWKDRSSIKLETCEWLGKMLYGKYGTDPCFNIKRTYGDYSDYSSGSTGLWYDSRKAGG